MANQVNTAVFEYHKFDFSPTAEYLISCQLMRDNGNEGDAATNRYLQAANLVVIGVLVHHNKVCKHTNLGSTEEFWVSVAIFATILASTIEQQASQLEELFVDSQSKIAMFSGSTPRPMIAGVVFLLFLIFLAGSNDDKASVNHGELHTRRAAQTSLMEITIVYMCMWIDYLRWKFRLLPTDLANEENVNGVLTGSTSALCLRSHWTSGITFPDDDIENHTPASATLTGASSGVCVGTYRAAHCDDKGN